MLSCAAHEKAGDSAAAVGDWKRAVNEYRTAVQKNPSDAKLRQKYAEAKGHAVATSTRKAQSCGAQGNWECALSEADFATSLDDSLAPTLAPLRADAARHVALSKVSEARAATSRNDLDSALASLRSASKTSSSTDVAEAVRAASIEWSASAASAAESLRQSRRYPEALNLLSSAAEYDPTLKSRVVALQAEYEQFKAAEHDRLVAEGDAAVASKKWADAAERFQSAQQMRADSRAAAAERYARAMAAGDTAVSKGEWRAAEQSYRAALDSGQDRSDAARALDAVTVRTYTIRLSSILVQPARPDGQPWVGKPNPLFGQLVAITAGVVLTPAAGVVASKIVKAVESIPPENTPTLVVEITLPDGRRFATRPHRALYWNPASQLTVETNAYDQRPLVLRVVHREPNGTEAGVGTVQLPLREVATRRQLALTDASIARLELSADASGSSLEGTVSQDLQPVPDATNVAPVVSLPSPSSRGYKLARVECQVAQGDFSDEGGLDGLPDPYVELIQGGRIVYRSQVLKDQYQASWTPERSFLFVRPDEAVSVRVWDKDVQEDDLVFSYDFTVQAIGSGTVEARTQRGSYVRLSFEPRRGGP